MRGKNATQKLTFNDILKQTERRHSEMLMKKARLANRLAKRSRGATRRTAYAVKSNALSSLVKNLSAEVSVQKDIRLTDFVVVELRGEQSGLHLPVSNLG